MITVGNNNRVKESIVPIPDPVPETKSETSARKIMDGLASIKSKYDDSVAAEAKRYAEIAVPEETFETDDELMTRAKQELANIYPDKYASAEREKSDALSSAAKKREALDASFLAENSDVAKKRAGSLEAHAEKMARAGLSHSSVNELKRDAIEEDYRETFARMDRDYARKSQVLKDRIASAERAYEQAMRTYDISYALDLEKKLDKYKAQRDKLESEYNASAEKTRLEKEKEYLKQLAAINKAFESEHGEYTGAKRENYAERYRFVRDELAKMADTYRTSFLKRYGEELADYLGLYYDRLIRAQKGA